MTSAGGATAQPTLGASTGFSGFGATTAATAPAVGFNFSNPTTAAATKPLTLTGLGGTGKTMISTMVQYCECFL